MHWKIEEKNNIVYNYTLNYDTYFYFFLQIKVYIVVS